MTATPTAVEMIAATGLGPLPGVDPLESARMVAGELPDLPFLPELPARGPWAAGDGRASAFLAEMHVDLQPAGWRLVPRPGMDERRRDSFLARDLDAIEEALAGRSTRVKGHFTGPWSLAATLELPRAGKVLADAGAVRDVVAALAEGASRHVADLRRRTSSSSGDADQPVVVQVDEPLLGVVLEGGVSTASGLGRIAAVSTQETREGLSLLAAAIVEAGGIPVISLPAAAGLVEVARAAGFAGVVLDATRLGTGDDETMGAALESGIRLIAGCIEVGATEEADRREALRPLRELWSRLGLASSLAPQLLTLAPRTALAECSPSQAKDAMGAAQRFGAWLASEPEEWLR